MNQLFEDKFLAAMVKQNLAMDQMFKISKRQLPTMNRLNSLLLTVQQQIQWNGGLEI